MAMFSNANVGDRVYSLVFGWGNIKAIDVFDSDLLLIKFKRGEDTYLSDGRRFEEDENPTLFWDVPDFEFPKKPFNLKAEYKKLKRKEFVAREENYYFTVHLDYWDCYTTDRQAVGTYYYKDDFVYEFARMLNENKITTEQLEEVIKEVENEAP